MAGPCPAGRPRRRADRCSRSSASRRRARPRPTAPPSPRCIGDDAAKPALHDAWAVRSSRCSAGRRATSPAARAGPRCPTTCASRLPEHDTTLEPDLGGRRSLETASGPGSSWSASSRRASIPTRAAALDGWEATPHQRFERLLRETGVFAGLLVSSESRDGEDATARAAAHLCAARRDLRPARPFRCARSRPSPAGRCSAASSCCSTRFRLFTDADRPPPAGAPGKSREAQAAVSTALAEQVLGALHELLRGLDAAEPDADPGARAHAARASLRGPAHGPAAAGVHPLCRGPRPPAVAHRRPRARRSTRPSYSVRGLYARLAEDAALNPDTMDERRGGWGRLLALFRLIHKGHRSRLRAGARRQAVRSGSVPVPRRARRSRPTRRACCTVSDGCVLRILEGLMTLQREGRQARAAVLPHARRRADRLGLRDRDGLHGRDRRRAARSRSGPARTTARRCSSTSSSLLAAKGKDRIKFLKEEADRGQLSANGRQGGRGREDRRRAGRGARRHRRRARLAQEARDRAPARRSCSRPTSAAAPAATTRRASLTEPIVRHALEPAFERLGPDATPEQILDLKVCDPAMGSGAFLVEACRALATRLVEAWARHPEKKPAIPADEDEELHARRLVAQRCLYGVDKNPLATDLAKLSLWLATLARDHEFTFLDHALKSGDSLVGLTQAQIAAAHWDTSKPGLPLFRQLVKDRVAEAMKGRAEIQAAPDDTARAIQEQRHRSLEARLKDIRLMGDAVIAAFFAEDKPKAREKKRAEVESWLTGSPERRGTSSPPWPRP